MNGETKLVGILGWPVSHSKSPAMQNAAFLHHKLNWAYVPLPVHPNHRFEAALKGLASMGFRGANVTVPYKENAAAHADEISKEGKAIGAVNTLIVNEHGKVFGENTDAPGFLAHLAEEEVEVQGSHVAVIGAGGAARAIVYALIEAHAKEVLVINRNEARGQALAERFHVSHLPWSRESFERAVQCDLIINTTPLGLSSKDPLPWDEKLHFRPNQVVYDVIYRPTPFLTRAKLDGAHAIGGGGMLLWQGVLAFKLWTGLDAPIDVMRRELNNAG